MKNYSSASNKINNRKFALKGSNSRIECIFTSTEY